MFMGLWMQASDKERSKPGRGSDYHKPAQYAQNNRRARTASVYGMEFTARGQFSPVDRFKTLALVPPGALAVDE
jgi:hypothetical protein